MGLDSVELIMSWEKYFNVNIPDREAEKLATLNDATNYFCDVMNIKDNSRKLQLDIFEKLKQALYFNNFKKPDDINELVIDYIPSNELLIWNNISLSLDMKFTNPANEIGIFKKITTFLNIQKSFKYELLTFENIIDTICAENFKTLINENDLKSRYEIYIILMALTVEKNGLDYYEIHPDKFFTTDYGID